MISSCLTKIAQFLKVRFINVCFNHLLLVDWQVQPKDPNDKQIEDDDVIVIEETPRETYGTFITYNWLKL